MKLEVWTEITLAGDTCKGILVAAISPENNTMPEGAVTTEEIGNKVVTKIKGKMTLGRLMNTIDDVVNTAILASKVASSN